MPEQSPSCSVSFSLTWPFLYKWFQFFNRNQMRPANHNMVRAPMPGPAINPNHPPNTQAAMQPYTNANPAMNVMQLILLLLFGKGFP